MASYSPLAAPAIIPKVYVPIKGLSPVLRKRTRQTIKGVNRASVIRDIDRSPSTSAARNTHQSAELEIHRRELLAGTALGLCLTAENGLLGMGSALAEEPVFWNGVGRRPHAVITGANTGIGKAAAEEMARRGWAVTLACRSPAKAEAAAKEIIAVTGSDAIDCRTLDLASLSSVHDFASSWGVASERPVDALINNAGVMAVYPQEFTQDGFELTLGVNHLGHFLLTCLMEDAVKAGSVNGSAGGRIVTTSSAAHQLASGIAFDDLFYEKRDYKRWGAYGQSKLANILMMRELDRRCQEAGCGVTAYSFHPGVVDTELIRYLVPQSVMDDKKSNKERSAFTAQKIFGLKSPEEGASTGVYLATSREVAALHSEYFDNCKLGACNKAGRDMDAAARLWEASVNLTGAPKDAWAA